MAEKRKHLSVKQKIALSEKNKIGAPAFPYDQNIADQICNIVSTSTDGLKKICKEHSEFPNHVVINQWRLAYPNFAYQYENAKRTQAELLAEEILEIADDSARDTIVDAEGNVRFNSEWLARSRLRVDTRKWVASKLLPKIYGDNSKVETTVTVRHEDALKELE